MPSLSRTLSIVPNGDDQNVYIVLDDFGRKGRAYRETDVERADLEVVIMDLLEGEYKNPVRVVGFNTAEKWSQDVSADVALELRRRCDLQMRDVPFHLESNIRNKVKGPRLAACGLSIHMAEGLGEADKAHRGGLR